MSAELFNCTSYTTPCQHIRGFHHSTAHSQEEQLHIAIKKYVPLAEVDARDDGREKVTIIACHALGMMKELYEPLFDELFKAAEAPGSTWAIRSIWIADFATHGESARLNEGKLGIDVCWDDHARDLLHMVNVFRDQMPQPLVGFGHSMGGQNIVQLSLLHPRLFAAVIPIEPIINPTHELKFVGSIVIISRRDVWESRDEAYASTSKGILMRNWDRRVLERWKQYGFRDLPTLLYPEAPKEIAAKASKTTSTPVTLASTKHHEAHGFARHAYPAPGQPLASFTPAAPSHADLTREEQMAMNVPFYRPEAVLTSRQLPLLRPFCLYLWGEKSPFSSASPKSRKAKLEQTGSAPGGSGGVKTNSVAEIVLANEGHFVPFEKPELVAGAMHGWLGPMLQRWREEHAVQDKIKVELDPREMAMVGEDWRHWAREWYAPKPKGAKL